MKKEQKALLLLIRLGIGNEGVTEQNIQQLQDEGIDWEQVMQLSYMHSLSVIAADGYSAVKAAKPDARLGIDNKNLWRKKAAWLSDSLSAQSDYDKYRSFIRSIAKFYARHDIPMMLLKGYGLSLNYPVPSHRPMGDVDIYLFGKWQEADALIRGKGIEVKDDCEHHTKFLANGFSVENHYDFINVRIRRSSRSLEKIFKQLATDQSDFTDLDGVKVYLPSPNLNALFLLRHTAGHFASEGIMLRPLLDWAFFVKKHGDRVDWKWLIDTARDYNMHIFLSAINYICISSLGFEASIFPKMERYPEYEGRILAEVLKGPDIVKDASAWLRTKRWWQHRWKHHICYSDSMLSSFFTSVASNVFK